MQVNKDASNTPVPILPQSIVGDPQLDRPFGADPSNSPDHARSQAEAERGSCAHAPLEDGLAPSRGVVLAIAMSLALWGGVVAMIAVWRLL